MGFARGRCAACTALFTDLWRVLIGHSYIKTQHSYTHGSSALSLSLSLHTNSGGAQVISAADAAALVKRGLSDPATQVQAAAKKLLAKWYSASCGSDPLLLLSHLQVRQHPGVCMCDAAAGVVGSMAGACRASI